MRLRFNNHRVNNGIIAAKLTGVKGYVIRTGLTEQDLHVIRTVRPLGVIVIRTGKTVRRAQRTAVQGKRVRRYGPVIAVGGIATGLTHRFSGNGLVVEGNRL